MSRLSAVATAQVRLYFRPSCSSGLDYEVAIVSNSKPQCLQPAAIASALHSQGQGISVIWAIGWRHQPRGSETLLSENLH